MTCISVTIFLAVTLAVQALRVDEDGGELIPGFPQIYAKIGSIPDVNPTVQDASKMQWKASTDEHTSKENEVAAANAASMHTQIQAKRLAEDAAQAQLAADRNV